jgi:hypothetical protein
LIIDHKYTYTANKAGVSLGRIQVGNLKTKTYIWILIELFGNTNIASTAYLQKSQYSHFPQNSWINLCYSIIVKTPTKVNTNA